MKIITLICLMAFTSIMVVGCGTSHMYKSPEHEQRIQEIYSNKLLVYPVSYEIRMINTQYGFTHIVASGEQDKPPIILLHAMGVTSMMWLDNIRTLSTYFRVYAIDMVGDIGRSTLHMTENPINDETKYVEWLTEVLDSLQITKANIVGASMGGWGGLQFARIHPERTQKLALLGPMGIPSASIGTIFKILSLVWFPTDAKKEEMIEWTLGKNNHTKNQYTEHMRWAMDCRGFLPTPWTLSDSELQTIQNPVMLVLGENDDVAGPAFEAKDRAEKHFPMVQIHLLKNAGHMMNSDQPATVDSLIISFF